MLDLHIIQLIGLLKEIYKYQKGSNSYVYLFLNCSVYNITLYHSTKMLSESNKKTGYKKLNRDLLNFHTQFEVR
jgi:hypothetical protein